MEKWISSTDELKKYLAFYLYLPTPCSSPSLSLPAFSLMQERYSHEFKNLKIDGERLVGLTWQQCQTMGMSVKEKIKLLELIDQEIQQ